MPRSTSKTERSGPRRTQPQPPPPELAGPIIPIPELKASGPHQRRETEGGRQKARTSRLPPPAFRRLAETAGPEPATPPQRVRLTVGSILAPHGVRGEFKVRLQTDAPEHLLKVKRLYLGDEQAPRTVLGARLHAGHALLRLQGISSPETVTQFIGFPLRISGLDARPLAPNEFFLYQMIGLEARDEAGNRLGHVTDLIETGANDVLVVSPVGGGADILFPSHPDVVIAMEPAAGFIVVRPLQYYGE